MYSLWDTVLFLSQKLEDVCSLNVFGMAWSLFTDDCVKSFIHDLFKLLLKYNIVLYYILDLTKSCLVTVPVVIFQDLIRCESYKSLQELYLTELSLLK